MLLSIIVVTYNNEELIDSFFESAKTFILDKVDSEIIFVDNKSSDNTIQQASKYLSDRVKLIKLEENRGYAAGINSGVRESRGDVIALCNPDIIFEEFDRSMLELVKRTSVGVAWVKIIERGKKITHTSKFPTQINCIFDYIPFIGDYSRGKQKIKILEEHAYTGWGCGCFCFVSRESYDCVNGWDEKYFLFKEETDFAQMLCRIGRKSVYTEKISIIHLGGQSTKKIGDKMKVYREKSNIYYYNKYGFNRFIFLYLMFIYKTMYLITKNSAYKEIFCLYKQAWSEKA